MNIEATVKLTMDWPESRALKKLVGEITQSTMTSAGLTEEDIACISNIYDLLSLEKGE